jgi:NAD(P)-dependent dehydrogenase (short-subunit alcohol dehydrogenase family)
VDLELAGTVTMITGGTDGLGLALAQHLVAEGGAVAICGRDAARLAAAAEGLESAGADVLARQADVEQATEIQGFVDAVADRWGRIDGVVHNAGRSAAGKLEETDDALWEGDLQLKLMGAVRLTRMALPHLRQRGGSAVFTLAMAAKAPGAGSAPSSVSRAAGMALMKALSKELAPDGIRVNAILIGLIESGQWVRGAAAAGVALPEYYARLAAGAGIPLGRVGRSAEFADLASFLLSARSSYLTGTAINLDGGLSPAGLLSSVVTLHGGGVTVARRRQRDGVAVDPVQSGHRVDMGPTVTTPFLLSRFAGRRGVLGHHEDHLVVLAHAVGGQLAPEKRGVEMHQRSVATTKEG